MERLPRAVLHEIQHLIRNYVRGRNGVYALYRGKQLYYVGLARDLRVRLNAHLKDRHADSWDSFSIYLTLGDGHLRELESLVIRIVRPSGNTQIGNFRESEDLRRRFTKDLRRHFAARMQSMLGIHATPPKRLEVRGRTGQPPLARHLDSLGSRRQLRAAFKGKALQALVMKDGRIRFKGKIYNSPSSAAEEAIGKSCNGWTFWSFQRAPSDWALLDVLRKR
jgi:hypothetical protein